jgi:hypothetical protein
MSKKKIGLFLVLIVAFGLILTFTAITLKTKNTLSYVDDYGGWIAIKAPYNTKSLHYYNAPTNWRETEQLLGQASLKFSSSNQFSCEWQPVHNINNVVWILTECAEKIANVEEIRSSYIMLRTGSAGEMDAYFIPIGNDYDELVRPFVTLQKETELLEKLDKNLQLRLASDYEISPLVTERKGLLD